MVQSLTSDAAVALPSPHRAMRFRSLWRLFVESRLGPVGLGILVIVALAAILAPVIAPEGPFELGAARLLRPGQDGHLLGTDHLGRDMLAQVVYGARVSLVIGLVAA